VDPKNELVKLAKAKYQRNGNHKENCPPFPEAFEQCADSPAVSLLRPDPRQGPFLLNDVAD
jgi:hypothetical protein